GKYRTPFVATLADRAKGRAALSLGMLMGRAVRDPWTSTIRATEVPLAHTPDSPEGLFIYCFCPAFAFFGTSRHKSTDTTPAFLPKQRPMTMTSSPSFTLSNSAANFGS